MDNVERGLGVGVFKEQENSKYYTSITKKKEKNHLKEDDGDRELRRITIPKYMKSQSNEPRR